MTCVTLTLKFRNPLLVFRKRYGVPASFALMTNPLWVSMSLSPSLVVRVIFIVVVAVINRKIYVPNKEGW